MASFSYWKFICSHATIHYSTFHYGLTDDLCIVYRILKMLKCTQNIDSSLWYYVRLVIDHMNFIFYDAFQWKMEDGWYTHVKCNCFTQWHQMKWNAMKMFSSQMENSNASQKAIGRDKQNERAENILFASKFHSMPNSFVSFTLRCEMVHITRLCWISILSNSS